MAAPTNVTIPNASSLTGTTVTTTTPEATVTTSTVARNETISTAPQPTGPKVTTTITPVRSSFYSKNSCLKR